MQITTPPPGDWLEGGQVTVIGKGPRGEARWFTATTNGREWTDPAQVRGRPGDDPGAPTLLPADAEEPTLLPADAEDAVAEQIPAEAARRRRRDRR